ncbi:MAG: hypothetical protein ACI4UM_00360 [Succinivibrio sp.]
MSDTADENPYENKAGPSMIFEALDHVRRLTGTERISEKPRVKYLPEDVIERRQELEDSIEKESSVQESNESDDEIGDSLFYKKAMSHVKRLDHEKKAVLEKITRNFRVFLIIILAFAGYCVYSVFTRADDGLSSRVRQLQEQLPLSLDRQTTLTGVNVNDDEFTLNVVMSKDAFSSQDTGNALDLYVNSASSNFCKIQFFSDMIKQGRRIVVHLSTDDNSVYKEFSVSACQSRTNN